MIKLGYIDEDLNYLTFEEFIQKNPNLINTNYYHQKIEVVFKGNDVKCI